MARHSSGSLKEIARSATFSCFWATGGVGFLGWLPPSVARARSALRSCSRWIRSLLDVRISRYNPDCRLTTAFTCRAGCKERDVWKDRNARPDKCNAWILIMVSLGMGRGLSQGYTAQGRGLGPTWKFQEGARLPTTIPAQGPGPMPKETMHALLQATASILLRSRFARQNDVRLHPRPAGNIVAHQDLPAEPAAFLEAIAPYRAGLVVACECLFCWYWLAAAPERCGPGKPTCGPGQAQPLDTHQRGEKGTGYIYLASGVAIPYPGGHATRRPRLSGRLLLPRPQSWQRAAHGLSQRRRLRRL